MHSSRATVVVKIDQQHMHIRQHGLTKKMWHKPPYLRRRTGGVSRSGGMLDFMTGPLAVSDNFCPNVQSSCRTQTYPAHGSQAECEGRSFHISFRERNMRNQIGIHPKPKYHGESVHDLGNRTGGAVIPQRRCRTQQVGPYQQVLAMVPC